MTLKVAPLTIIMGKSLAENSERKKPSRTARAATD